MIKNWAFKAFIDYTLQILHVLKKVYCFVYIKALAH